MNVFGSRDVSAFRLDDNLGSYMRQIRTFPMLAFDEEQRLARRWVEHRYIDAAHKLVTSRMLGAFRDDAAGVPGDDRRGAGPPPGLIGRSLPPSSSLKGLRVEGRKCR